MAKKQFPYQDTVTDTLPGEKWTVIDNTNGKYMISNEGRVASLWPSKENPAKKYRKILSPSVKQMTNEYSGHSYYQLHIGVKMNGKQSTIKISRMVYYYFVKKFNLQNRKVNVVHTDAEGRNCSHKNLKMVSKSDLITNMYAENRKSKPTKTVSCYDSKGRLLKTYESTVEAAKDLGINQSSIAVAAIGKKPAASGYLWKYGTAKRVKAPAEGIRYVKQVEAYSKTGKLLKTYKNMKRASEETGVPYEHIQRSAKTGVLLNGRTWKLID